MEGTPKRKTAIIWRKTNQNTPTRQRCGSANSGNVNKQRWRHDILNNNKARYLIGPHKQPKQQSSALSKTEPDGLIGQKVNRVSCFTSISHKQNHATVRGRNFVKQNSQKEIRYKTVSQEKKLVINSKKRSLKSPGPTIPKNSQSRPPGSCKVRYKKKDTGRKTSKINKNLTHLAPLGRKMESNNRQKPNKSKKDAKRKAKNSKQKQDDREFDMAAFSRAVERANKLVKSREPNKPLKQEELRKSFAAIEATVRKTPRAQPIYQEPQSAAHESEAREDTEPTSSRNYSTGRTKIPSRKRKRKQANRGNQPESDSSDEDVNPPNKRSLRSRISDSDRSTKEDQASGLPVIPETNTPGHERAEETPQEYHRRMKMKIRQGKKGSDESRTRLRNRSNQLFDHEGINEHGNRFYRRNPNKEFKPDPVKPGEGSAIVNHEKGKMLTAKQITADQTAGKTLNPYLNGDGFQLRLAEAIRIAKKLCRPKVKRNKRIKGKNGNPSQLRVDRRLRWALVNLRRLRKAHIAFDQWLYPELGAFPVYEDQRKIKYICLGDSSENETAKRKAHPDGFMGTEIKNKKRDSAKKLLSVLTLNDAGFLVS